MKNQNKGDWQRKILHSIEVDSLKLSFELNHYEPLNQIKILDTRLGTEYRKITIDGEEMDEKLYKENARQYGADKAPIYMSLVARQDLATKEVKTYLVILINSKHLGAHYFKGIKRHNVGNIYDAIIATKAVRMDYSIFMQGKVTDCDFKMDYQMEFHEWIKLNEFARKRTKLHTRSDSGYTRFPKKDNGIDRENYKMYGTQWSFRTTTSFATAPYIKMYHKGLEAEHRSSEFFSSYEFEGYGNTVIDYSDIVRTEYTIKNKKHFKQAGMVKDDQDNTLENILNFNYETKLSALIDGFAAHWKKEKARITQVTGLKGVQLMLAALIDDQVKQGGKSKSELRDTALSLLPKKNQERYKKLFEEVWRYLAIEEDFRVEAENNEAAYNWFKILVEGSKNTKLRGMFTDEATYTERWHEAS